MKCHVSCEEEWPVYSLEKSEGSESNNINFPEHLYHEYIWIIMKYKNMQQHLKEFYELQRSKSDQTHRWDLPENYIFDTPAEFNKL